LLQLTSNKEVTNKISNFGAKLFLKFIVFSYEKIGLQYSN